MVGCEGEISNLGALRACKRRNLGERASLGPIGAVVDRMRFPHEATRRVLPVVEIVVELRPHGHPAVIGAGGNAKEIRRVPFGARRLRNLVDLTLFAPGRTTVERSTE